MISPLLLTNFRRLLHGWFRDARNHAIVIKRSRMLPMWFAFAIVAVDFLLVSLSFHYANTASLINCALWGVLQYAVRLTFLAFALVWASVHYQVPKESLGIRPNTLLSDIQWSSRICALVAVVILATVAAGFVVSYWLGLRLPAPPDEIVQTIPVDGRVSQFLILASLGALILAVLAPITEELIYRSLFLPVLTSSFGLVPAVFVTATVFGLLHVIPFGGMGIALPQFVGGLIMAAGFSIRWSVAPAMVIHAMGNLCAGGLVFTYVQLYKAYPALFFSE